MLQNSIQQEVTRKPNRIPLVAVSLLLKTRPLDQPIAISCFPAELQSALRSHLTGRGDGKTKLDFLLLLDPSDGTVKVDLSVRD